MQAYYQLSAYRAPDFRLIPARELELPATLLEYLSQRKTFQRGMVLSALSYRTHSVFRPRSTLLTALGLPPRIALDPARIPNELDQANARSTKLLHVRDDLTVSQGAELLGLLHAQGTSRVALSDESLLARLSESGGNIGSFVSGANNSLQ